LQRPEEKFKREVYKIELSNKEEESYLPGWFDTGAKEAGRPAAKKDAQQRGIEQR